MKYEKFTDKHFKGELVKFFCRSFEDWKKQEKDILKEYPNAKNVCMPGLGYAGEYWYKI